MKVSIITAILNCRETIGHSMQSVSSQTYQDIEHIVIDGGSTDGTLEVIRNYEINTAKVISEPDNGMYDALNKGIRLSSGDIIGILNGDDFYAHGKVLETVVGVFETENVDSCYGDLVYVDKNDPLKIVRYWKSSSYHQGLFKKGWMPPHPTFFVRRELYQKYGLFNTTFRIAADYELMLRFLDRHRISTYYIPEVIIKMRVGGKSNKNARNMFMKSAEDYKALKMNNLNGAFYTIFLKQLSKIPQFFAK